MGVTKGSSTIAPEITIGDLRADIGRDKLWIAAFMILCGGSLAVYGAVVDRIYEASTIILPVTNGSGSGGMGTLGALASQYSGLASLAGLSLNGTNRSPENLEVLQSEYLTESFIKSHDLLPILYSKKWDKQTQKWTVSEPAKAPTLWKANQYFKKDIRSVTDDKTTGVVTLRIRWRDPEQAASWANDLVKMTNEYLRNKAIAEAERNIAYLNGEAAKTNVVELKQSIYSLIQQEINSEMIAKGREEFALKVIDPAYPPERPASLGITALATLGLLAGGLVSMVVVLLRRVYLSSKWTQ